MSFKYNSVSTTDTEEPSYEFVGKEDYNIKLSCQSADLPNVKQYIFICLASYSKEAVLSKSKQKWLTFQY